MSSKENNGYSSKCLAKEIATYKIYFYKSFDIKHGYGYFCHSVTNDLNIGFGFNKNNKLTAVRQSLII